MFHKTESVIIGYLKVRGTLGRVEASSVAPLAFSFKCTRDVFSSEDVKSKDCSAVIFFICICVSQFSYVYSFFMFACSCFQVDCQWKIVRMM